MRAEDNRRIVRGGRSGKRSPTVIDELIAAVESNQEIGPRESDVAAFFQEALDETEGMELPHAYHMLRAKVLSRISALTAPDPDGDMTLEG